jgi:hypothetical protein
MQVTRPRMKTRPQPREPLSQSRKTRG